MGMLWSRYVFRRGVDTLSMWDSYFPNRKLRMLYIAGLGFDLRAQTVLNSLVQSINSNGAVIDDAKLVLVSFSGYELSTELRDLTKENSDALRSTFEQLGEVKQVQISRSFLEEEDLSPTNALRYGVREILDQIQSQTDIFLDVSSMPRVVYLALLTALLQKLIPDRRAANPLHAGGITLHVLVAEDPALDALIQSEDPSNELVLIPGFSSALNAESIQNWPLAWFPILGDNRVSQLEKVLPLIPKEAEICPVLPHPSHDLRRADRLLVAYKRPLFDARGTPVANVFFVHESNPFEAYRQLLSAMMRYRTSLQILGGCRLVVTPLASKLITVGAGLACFEMRPESIDDDYALAIPYAEPTRYSATVEALRMSQPEIVSLVLTGEAYVS